MMKNLRQSKGITLIALVITILVLLILAGVAISMLAGENGIINKTNSAKAENETATVEEQVKLAVMAALAAGNGEIKGTDAFTALNDGLDDAGYEGDDIEEGDLPTTITIGEEDYVIEANGTTREPSEIEKLKRGEAVDTTTTLKDADGKQVVIPAEFKIAEDSASLVKDGIVVIAPDESEFVWVPVEDINSMVMCQSHKDTTDDCSIVKGDDGELKCENHTDTLICGKLYATGIGENFDSTLATQKYSVDSGLREPAVLTSTSYGDYVTGDDTKGVNLLSSIVGIAGDTTTEEGQTQIKNTWQTQLQDEFEEMAKSVYEHKGFYVGRYETSLKTLEDGTKVAQSRANQSSATADSSSANTWYGLYQVEKEYSTKNSLTDIVGSSMIWGSQYDQMMLWMKAKGLDIDVPQNESPNLGEGVEKNTNHTTTGVDGDKDKLNNVYDLLGCKYEWTLEAHYTTYRVNRGGNYRTSYSPSYRHNDNPYNTNSSNTSRATLYIK